MTSKTKLLKADKVYIYRLYFIIKNVVITYYQGRI